MSKLGVFYLFLFLTRKSGKKRTWGVRPRRHDPDLRQLWNGGHLKSRNPIFKGFSSFKVTSKWPSPFRTLEMGRIFIPRNRYLSSGKRAWKADETRVRHLDGDTRGSKSTLTSVRIRQECWVANFVRARDVRDKHTLSSDFYRAIHVKFIKYQVSIFFQELSTTRKLFAGTKEPTRAFLASP